MQKLSRNDHIDLYRHLAYCAVGGFFGCYAVLIHSGVMGNAQTVNLIELLLDALLGTAERGTSFLSAGQANGEYGFHFGSGTYAAAVIRVDVEEYTCKKYV